MWILKNAVWVRGKKHTNSSFSETIFWKISFYLTSLFVRKVNVLSKACIFFPFPWFGTNCERGGWGRKAYFELFCSVLVCSGKVAYVLFWYKKHFDESCSGYLTSISANYQKMRNLSLTQVHQELPCTILIQIFKLLHVANFASHSLPLPPHTHKWIFFY